MKSEKNWLIAGASFGLGLAAVKYLLSRKQIVIALVRDAKSFKTELIANPLLEVIILDPASEAEVTWMCEKIGAKYGLIDKLINNGGATQVMIRRLLPLMQTDGHIIDLSSGCGPAGIADATTQHAAQYQCGLSEEIFLKANDLGIKVTIIEQESPVPGFSNNQY